MFSRTLAMTFGSLALASMSLITSPATLDAQSRPVNRIRFAAMDRNNDGVISRQEWNGSARSFEVHDWNNDGRLSGNEVRSGAQRDTDLADHNPNTFERNLSWTRGNFNSLDHDRDNRLSVNEWHFDLETFRRVDSDRNDSLSLQEFLGQGVDDLRGDRFDDIDNNNNGRIERAETDDRAPMHGETRPAELRADMQQRDGVRHHENRAFKGSSVTAGAISGFTSCFIAT